MEVCHPELPDRRHADDQARIHGNARERNGGSIIHLLSTAAHFGQPSGAAYCTAKAALLNFARSAAMELAADTIRVNTITPCAMEHQLWTKMRKEVAKDRFERVKNRPSIRESSSITRSRSVASPAPPTLPGLRSSLPPTRPRS